MTTEHKPRRSPGRPPTAGPKAQRKAITLRQDEWATLDAMPGANRSEKLRYLMTFFLRH